MFLAMACDVARVLEKASASSHLLPTFISRIRSWQEFMRTGGRALGPVEEVGLYGELAVLRALVEEGVLATTAVGAWLGPVGGVQDFHLATGAIEVKSTLASKGFVARISSLEQLDDGLRQPLYLCGVRLRQVESDGRTLTGLVEQLRSLVASDAESARVLDDRLLAAGYHDAHAGEYARAFSVQDVLLLQVSDVFPRLTAGRVPRAIVHASYDVDLEYCGVASVDLKAALTKLGAICT